MKILSDYLISLEIDKTISYFKRNKYDEGLISLAERISNILIENKEPPGLLSRFFWFCVNNW